MNDPLAALYGKWNELKSKATADLSPIHKGDLDKDFNITQHRIKWLNIQSDWKQAYIVMEDKRKNVKKELTTFYKEEVDRKLDKEELSLYIDTDDKYVTLLQKVTIIKAIIDYCGDVIDALQGKHWEISNYLKWRVYVDG